MITDIHAHFMPGDYFALAKGRLGGSYADRFTGFPEPMSLEDRFAMMAEAGVGKQILSPTAAPYLDDEEYAVNACCLLNDAYAELSETQADKFGFWVSLPLPHVERALAEIRRGMDELGGKGVVLGCSCLEHSIADQRFEPIYAELNVRKAIVFLHPCQTGIRSPQVNEWGLTVCFGASLEDSVAALHLIVARIPERYPDIRFIVPHFGGILSTLLNRLDGQMPQDGFAEKPSVTARRFYYDMVGWGSKAALIAAVEAFGESQIVTGSDFPVLLHHESYKQTFDHVRNCDALSQAQKNTILSNADRLLATASRDN